VDGVELAEWLASRKEQFSALSENDSKGPARPAHSSSPGHSELPGGAQADASVQESAEGTQETPLRRA
jgi:hypothetical protein